MHRASTLRPTPRIGHAPTRVPIALLVSFLFVAVSVTAGESETASIDAKLAQAYAEVHPSQVPTGILLERGAVFFGPEVLRHHGGSETEEPLTPTGFDGALLDLRRGSFGAELATLEALNAYARSWRETHRATPISVALIDFDTLDGWPEPEVIDGVLQLPDGVLGATRRFVGARAWVDTVRSRTPDFVVPSGLLVLNGVTAEDIEAIEVRIGDAPPQDVTLDTPFRPAWLPSASGPLTFSVTVSTAGTKQTALGTVPFTTPKTKPTKQPPQPPTFDPDDPTSGLLNCAEGIWNADGGSGATPVRYWDLDKTVIGDPFVAPWDEAFQTSDRGRLSVRVIPAVPENLSVVPDADLCRVELTQPVVIVDGFDVFNNRTQESILDDFGRSIKKMLDLGFDIIMVDYQNGRDWIERNGRAFRKLMTVDITEMVDPEVLLKKNVAVVAGSMGTQVARWGLMEAESNGEDHFTTLFVNVDGPFAGANIPIGFQAAAVDLVSLAPTARAFVSSLESPAASQLLMRTFPRGSTLFSSGWYLPRVELNRHYDAAAALGGLPTKTRNVAAANGSGTGSAQTDLGSDVRLLRARGNSGIFHFEVEVRSDAPGSRVYRRRQWIELFGIPFFEVNHARSTPNGLGLDVMPGGFRQTSQDFIDGVGSFVFFKDKRVDLTYDFDIDRHAFVPTTSAFGSEDWNNRIWEKCNTPHGSESPAMIALIIDELLAFREGSTPPPAPLLRNPCDTPEPFEYCYPGVIWYADPDNPVYLRPWDDGANCYVTAQPSGHEALIPANTYAVAPSFLACFDGSQPVDEGCAYTRVDTVDDVATVSIPSDGRLHIEILTIDGGSAGPEDCPANTSYLRVIEGPLPYRETAVCTIDPLPGVPISAFFVEGLTVMVPPEQDCGLGIPRFLGGQHVCYLGSPPVGTEAFEFGTGFYYEGWD